MRRPTDRERPVRPHRLGPAPGRGGDPGQHGQVLPLVLVVLVLAVAVLLGIVRLGAAVARREAAQAAADAAALAGAAQGEEAARAVAAANRATVEDYRVEGDDVQVVVVRDGIRRTARARWVPTAAPVAVDGGARAAPDP